MDSPIVSTAWLENHLNDENLRIIDIRGYVLPATEPPPHYFNKKDEYDKSHIPGAVFVDWVREITDPADPRHAKCAPPERFAAVMSRCGVDADTMVVVYDDSGIFASRLWWMLNYYGHTKVVYLDGGWTKWTAENRPTTDVVPTIAPTTFVATPNPVIYRTIEQVERRSNDSVLVDVRTEIEFNGGASRAKRGGHIPGAINNHRSTLINEDGTFKDATGIREHLATININADTPEVVTYCNGGVSATFTLLAMAIAGYDNWAMYDGSWKEWGNDDNRPIE